MAEGRGMLRGLGWLDGLSPGWALLGGGVAGLVLATVSVVGIGGWVGVSVCGAVLLVAGVVGWRAEPEWKVEEVPVTPPVVKDLGGRLVMVELPGGTFWMGSAWYDREAFSPERPRHEVTVSAFAIAREPVTRGLYREVMESGAERQGDLEDDRLPATGVSWFNAVEFCNRLSAQAGLDTCYRIEGEEVTWSREADGYRLPTEAEWEYTCRAGTTTRWFCGDKSDDLGEYAWYGEDWPGLPHPVGEKRPNPWGLHDMAGNVWEWCWDWLGEYSKDPQINPDGPPTGEYRVLRGGSFRYEPRFLRSAFRRTFEPRDWLLNNSFRVVRGSRSHP